jgi:hypothetical protein
MLNNNKMKTEIFGNIISDSDKALHFISENLFKNLKKDQNRKSDIFSAQIRPNPQFSKDKNMKFVLMSIKLPRKWLRKKIQEKFGTKYTQKIELFPKNLEIDKSKNLKYTKGQLEKRTFIPGEK